MELNFKNGIALIKSGKKTIAKVIYRPDFFAKIEKPKFQLYDPEYPYSIQINGLQAQAKNFNEIMDLLNSEL